MDAKEMASMWAKRVRAMNEVEVATDVSNHVEAAATTRYEGDAARHTVLATYYVVSFVLGALRERVARSGGTIILQKSHPNRLARRRASPMKPMRSIHCVAATARRTTLRG